MLVKIEYFFDVCFHFLKRALAKGYLTHLSDTYQPL